MCLDWRNNRLLWPSYSQFFIGWYSISRYWGMYPKRIHITCLAHAYHRIPEEQRQQFPNVDLLISNCKKDFLKVPKQMKHFKMLPSIIRWGTWLSVVMYYCENYELIRDILLGLDENDGVSINTCRNSLDYPNMRTELIYISSKCNF